MTLTTPHLNCSERRNPITGKPLLVGLIGAWLATSAVSAAGDDDSASQVMHARVSPHAQTIATVAGQLWEWAELGYLEQHSSALLQQTLEAAGFEVNAGIGGIPTAFTASFGSGEPVIGIMGEFDALPGISQAPCPLPSRLMASPAAMPADTICSAPVHWVRRWPSKTGSNKPAKGAPCGFTAHQQRKAARARSTWLGPALLTTSTWRCTGTREMRTAPAPPARLPTNRPVPILGVSSTRLPDPSAAARRSMPSKP